MDELIEYARSWLDQDALAGVASLWDFAGALDQPVAPPTPFERTIAEAFEADWKAVGETMWVFLPPGAERDSGGEADPVAAREHAI